MNSLKTKAFIIYLMINFLFGFTLLFGQTNLSGKTQLYDFKSDSWSYYRTDNKNDSISEIISKYATGKFTRFKYSILNRGIPKQYYWIHFTISSKAQIKQLSTIEIDNSRLNELELFEVSSNVVKSLGKSGDFYPFSQRTIWHRNFIYEVPFDPNQQKEFFLFVNQIGNTFTLPVNIFTSRNFEAATYKDYLFDGVTYGILFFVGVTSLLFFITSRLKLYLYYGFYVLTAILWFTSYFGLGYQYLWGNYPMLNTSIAPFMASINILLNLQICQVLLRLDKANSFLNSMANLIKYVLIVVALFPFILDLNHFGYTINHAYLLVFLSAILFAMVIVSFSVSLYAIKGFIAARVYFIASLLKAGSIINLALLELGLVPAIPNMESYLQIGIFIEITLLTYALATRYAVFKVRTFEKVIEAHENERSLISREIHDGISGSLIGINYEIKNFIRGLKNLTDEKRGLLEKIFEELNKVQLEARSISRNTMPDYIKSSSLTYIVERYIEAIQKKANNNADEGQLLEINFSANDQLVKFSEAIKLNIFRIIQEIVANILKHSQATNVDIIFSFEKKEMIIIAEDNGVGFYSQSNDKKTKGMGINNIMSRVELLDGEFLIKSPTIIKRRQEPDLPDADSRFSTDHGTMIEIKIPYRHNLFKNKISDDF